MSRLPQIGLDIGSASIKLVELVQTKSDKWKLLAAASCPASGVQISETAHMATIAQTLVKMVKEAGVRSRRVVASLPEEKVSSHLVELPVLPDNEIAQALQWQVEQYIPMPIDQAVWSYQVVKKDEVTGNMEVLLVAASKVLVEAYRQVIESAGLDPVAFETELAATARSVMLSNYPLMVVVDIGARNTEIGIVRTGTLLFTRTVPTAGEAFTRAIETTLGLETSQAESYKNTYGFSASYLGGKLLTAMKPILGVISSEVRKTIDFYVSKHVGEAIKSVVLSGGIAVLPDIVNQLSSNLGLEVIVGNPLLRVEVDKSQLVALKGHEPFYAVAVGLAQRDD